MSLVTIERDGPVMLLTITRPDARNAINKATGDALRAAWQDFEQDDDARVAILTGGDTVFCAGADLKDLSSLAGDVFSDHGPLGFTRLTISKPTIAAVAGYAVAGGLEIACWCDLRIADETAVFGCFERRFGVPLVDGGTQRLPRIVGTGRALEMILTGRAVPAREALAWGLANEVVAPGAHIRRAVALGHMLAQFPQTAMRNDRLALYAGIGKSLAEGLRLEAEYGVKTLQTGEAIAGAQAFNSGKGRSGTFD